jgi:hypothetical protein
MSSDPISASACRRTPIIWRRGTALDSEALAAEIADQSKLAIDKLRERWRARYRTAPSRAIGRSFLTRVIAYRLQERAYDGWLTPWFHGYCRLNGCGNPVQIGCRENSQFGHQCHQKQYADHGLSDDVQTHPHSALTTAALGLFCLRNRTSGIMTRHSTPMSHATSMYDSTLAWVMTELYMRKVV